jgi:hypothetical protein
MQVYWLASGDYSLRRRTKELKDKKSLVCARVDRQTFKI